MCTKKEALRNLFPVSLFNTWFISHSQNILLYNKIPVQTTSGIAQSSFFLHGGDIFCRNLGHRLKQNIVLIISSMSIFKSEKITVKSYILNFIVLLKCAKIELLGKMEVSCLQGIWKEKGDLWNAAPISNILLCVCLCVYFN